LLKKYTPMKYRLEIFSNEGGPNIFYPPKMQVPLLIAPGLLDSAVCDRLAKEILKRERALLMRSAAVGVAGKTTGVTTRWLDYNVLSWDLPEIQEVKTAIKGAYLFYLKKLGVARWSNEIQCWANVLRKGDQLKLHHHNFRKRPVISATISLTSAKTGTCYVSPYVLRRQANGDHAQEICFTTQKGNLIMAPGWVSHYTTPNPVNAPRITLGIDIVSGMDVGTLLPFDGGKRFRL